MKRLSTLLFIISLISLATGLTNAGSSEFSGLCRAMGAVFFILAYIRRAMEKAESMEPFEAPGKVENSRSEENQPSGQPLTPAQHAH